MWGDAIAQPVDYEPKTFIDVVSYRIIFPCDSEKCLMPSNLNVSSFNKTFC